MERIRSKGREIVFLDFATRRQTRLGTASLTPHDGGLAVSRGGNSLFFVRVDHSESDLMMARLEHRESLDADLD